MDALFFRHDDIGNHDINLASGELLERGLPVAGVMDVVVTDIPFIMITGNADKESIMTAKNIGVTSYIAKPYSSKHLEKKLRAISRIVALRAEGKS